MCFSVKMVHSLRLFLITDDYVQVHVCCMYRYDSSMGLWEGSEPMLTLRSRVGVAVVNKKLFAFGGYDGSSRLSTVECYSPRVCQ